MPSAAVSAVKLPIQTDSSLGFNLYDCSNAAFKCVGSWYYYFAVPRKPLTIGEQYTTVGVRFKVEACFREVVGSCQVALISADCKTLYDSYRCSQDRVEGDSPALDIPVVYFIYNDDYGVTAFGEAVTHATSVKDAKHVAAQQVLLGNYGLLSQRVTIGVPYPSAKPR